MDLWTPIEENNENQNKIIVTQQLHSNNQIINLPIKYTNDPHAINKTIGVNKKIRLIPSSNNNLIYDIYSLVRKQFLKFNVVTNQNCSLSTSDWSSIVLKTVINSLADYYHSDIALRGYFDEIIPISCNGKLFCEHHEWIMPVFHTQCTAEENTDTQKYLYLLIDITEIEKFFTYYIYAYKTTTIKFDVEFSDIDINNDKRKCQKIKSFLVKKNDTIIDIPTFKISSTDCKNQINNTEKSTETIKEYDIHNFMFGFTLLCVDKILAITNNMLIQTGKNNTKNYKLNTSIIEILGEIEITLNKKKSHSMRSTGVVTFESIN